MTIQNCKISKSETIFWVDDQTTTIRLKLVSAEGTYPKDLLTANGNNQTKKLFQFAGVRSSSELAGKVIREVRDAKNVVVGYGDPIEDEFFLSVKPGGNLYGRRIEEEEFIRTGGSVYIVKNINGVFLFILGNLTKM